MRYLVAGGVAANLHGSVRATKDVDILVPRDVGNMRRLVRALAELPYGVARELDAEEMAAKPLTIVGDDPRVDVMTVAWTLTYGAAIKNREARTIRGVRVLYLSRGDLIRTKRTGRPQDLADIEALGGPPTRRRARSR